MTPAARLAAAIEVLDQLAANGAPAEGALKAWGRTHRYAGSGDRRTIGDIVFRCLREKGRLAAAMGAKDGRALVLGSLRLLEGKPVPEIDVLFTGQGYAPKPLTAHERSRLQAMAETVGLGLPPYVEAQLRASFGDDWEAEAEALLRTRAPLDIRVNAARASRDEVQAALPVASAPTPWSALGLRLESAEDLAGFAPFQQGWFEVQDEGSQVCAFLAGAGGVIVDYCAGGGGKTLALAQGRPSRLVACDTDAKRLAAIKPRLARAGIKAELRLLGESGEGVEDLAGLADLVLVDAPCSGSGTWRRRPEAAWRIDQAEIEAFAALQAQVLARAAALVRPGGRLAYVTCSVLAAENAAVVDAFAAAHADFRPASMAQAADGPYLTEAARPRLAALSDGGHRLQLSPRRTGTDGFFIALYERTA